MKTKQAIDFFGGQKELADALGIDRTAISHWGDNVPVMRQFQIQILSKGKLVAESCQKKAA